MGRRAGGRERAAAGRRGAGALALCAIPLWLGGCVRQTVVLVPDPDGRVGAAEVVTARGTQRLSRPGDMTRVGGPAAPPSAVTTADPAYVAATFAEALAVEPPPPERFTLYFELGTTTLDPRSRSAFPAIAAAVARRGALSVTLSGHGDATGTHPLNDRLSRARAERVEAALRALGVAPGIISVSSHGKRRPAVPTPDGVAELRNRRVEIVVR